MKRTVLNLGAILVAFIIGLAINNACADSLDNMTDTELRKLVSQLQQEVIALKNRVTELESKVGNNSNSGAAIGGAYAFEVDGIHFGMDGNCCDPIDYNETVSSYQIVGGVRTDYNNPSMRIQYTYDSHGRISSYFYNTETSEYVSQYSYSNKSCTVESKIIYKNPSPNSLSESGTKTVYYLK